MQGYSYLFWAYNVIWICLAGYLLFLFVRMRRLDRRLDRIEGELDRRAGSDRQP